MFCSAGAERKMAAGESGGWKHPQPFRRQWRGAVGAGAPARSAAAFPQIFAEKGERADLADYQPWHRICVSCKPADKVARLLFS